MRPTYWFPLALIASFIAFSCSSGGESPDDVGESGGQSTDSGGTASGGSGGGGTTPGSGGVAINPETQLPVYWEVVLELEEGDRVKVFDDQGAAVQRSISVGEYTDDVEDQLHYLAPGADSLTQLTSVTYTLAATDDPNFVYVSSYGSDGPLIGRVRKPGSAAGLGGAAGVSTEVEPLFQSNIDAWGMRVGQDAARVFFMFYVNSSLTTAPEAELWSVDKSTGASTLLAEDFPPFTGELLVANGAVHFLDPDYREIHSVPVSGGQVVASAEYPSRCDILVRNDARDGWWAHCEGTSTTDLVLITPQGEPLVFQADASFFPQTETQSTPTYLVTAAESSAWIFDTRTSTVAAKNLSGAEFVAVVGDYLYAEVPGFLVRVALDEPLFQ